MKVTFILKDWTDAFYNGSEFTGPGFLSLSDADKFAKLSKMTHEFSNVKMKIGSANAFRDRVELNQIMREPVNYNFKLEPRKGYKLATFDIRKSGLNRNPTKRKKPRTAAQRAATARMLAGLKAKRKGVTAAQIRAAHNPVKKNRKAIRYARRTEKTNRQYAGYKIQVQDGQEWFTHGYSTDKDMAFRYARTLHASMKKPVRVID